MMFAGGKKDGCWRMVLMVMVLAVSGCVTSPSKDQLGPKRVFNTPAQIPSGEAVVFFFREDGVKTTHVPNVWTEHRLVGALMPASYAQGRLCAGTTRIGIAHRGSKLAEVSYTPIKVRAGEVIYVRIHAAATDLFAMEVVAADKAIPILERMERTSQIVSRSAHACVRVADIQKTTPLIQVVQDTDALFDFDRAAFDDILPLGRTRLDELVDSIRQAGVFVEHVRITGHTDRLGSVAYNNRLSIERANSIARYLRAKGLTGSINVVGQGKKFPVSKRCVGNKATPELIACLQPDRRVTIELWGQREGK
jgi:OOP family OmpA-OmpF porin